MIEYKKKHQAYFILNVTDLQIAKDFFADIFDFKILFDYDRSIAARMCSEIRSANLDSLLSNGS